MVTAYVTYEMGAAVWKAEQGELGDAQAAYAWDEAGVFLVPGIQSPDFLGADSNMDSQTQAAALCKEFSSFQSQSSSDQLVLVRNIGLTNHHWSFEGIVFKRGMRHASWKAGFQMSCKACNSSLSQ